MKVLFRRALISGFAVAGLIAVNGSIIAQRSGATSKTPARHIKTLAELNAEDPPCRANLDDCPLAGCSKNDRHDHLLNQLKNISDLDLSGPKDVTLDWLKGRTDPKGFTKPGPREKLKRLGEGTAVRTTGYLLIIRKEPGGESCNCGLHSEAETDNHLVLVTPKTLKKFPVPAGATQRQLKTALKLREPESVTVEFTPRVRRNHPNFAYDKVAPLFKRTAQGGVRVRITGQLFFDSEHFFRHKLVRVNNWEIHPVFKFEYCPMDKTCTDKGTSNWIDLDMP